MTTDSIYIVEMSDSETSASPRFSKKLEATKELIELVEQKPCLWDRSLRAYKDRLEKDRAWRDIYRFIEPAYDTLDDTKKNIIGNLITRKWYNIRDSYVKSRRGLKSKPYKYAAMMNFLDPVYLKIPSKTKRTYIEQDEEDEGEWLNEVLVDIDQSRDNEDPPPKKSKIEYTPSTEDREENIISILANLIQKEEDEDRAFFKSIIPSVKKLSDSAKFDFRIHVLKLLSVLKTRDRRGGKEKRETAIESDSE